MKALVIGSKGQLGRALMAEAPADAVLEVHDLDTLDITDRHAVDDVVARFAPDVIFNTAAYTAVDKAETEERLASAVNAQAVAHLAAAAVTVGARLVQISTDFVFDGSAGSPYPVDAPTNPLGAYGRTKLAGERAAGENALIVRTAWLYGPGGANFPATMLRLMAERDALSVVADQIGTPSYAPQLAAALWQMVKKDACGIFHYTDSGVASWYDFAVAIQEEAIAAGLLERAIAIRPIATSEYPTPARRPAFSVLDKSRTTALLGEAAPHWRENLRRYIARGDIAQPKHQTA